MPSIINATTTNGLSTSADNSGSLQLATNNGTTAVTIDTSQRVGVGTTSPNTTLEVNKTITFSSVDDFGQFIVKSASGANGKLLNFGVDDANNFSFIQSLNRGDNTNNLVLQRYGGNVLVGKTAADFAVNGFEYLASSNILRSTATSGVAMQLQRRTTTGSVAGFFYNGTQVGSIDVTGSATSYVTSSDYRLKENIAPMTGALDKVQSLKPVTYTWKADGSDGQGFIAHELQAVVPECVTGEKDAVDEDGNIKPQGIDTSFLVATLTAAIQELNAKVEAQAVRIAELEGAK
jgi:hypothetical protein